MALQIFFKLGLSSFRRDKFTWSILSTEVGPPAEEGVVKGLEEVTGLDDELDDGEYGKDH